MHLLGGKDSRVVKALEKIVGGVLIGVAVKVPAVLALFDAKAEVVRLSHELIRGLSERRSGISRYGRTQRLEAAHAVIAVTAFFEALEEAELPLRFGELELTREEQLAAASSWGFPERAELSVLLTAHIPVPRPQGSHESTLAGLSDYYEFFAYWLKGFVSGLAVWDRLGERDRERFLKVVESLPGKALVRYEELLRRLAADFPEVACWMNLREHQATRDGVRTALARVEEILTAISTGREPDERRASMARAYRASLLQPIVEGGEVPEGLDVPALGEAYVVPRFRVADVLADFRPSDESWWAGMPVRDDLQEFLIGHLTSAQATRAPLLLLGQPGSGKSVLTKVLAARLPAADFMPVRVILRDVPAAADLQDQLEHAIRAATGERVDWPALVRSAGDALPVVLLDGFDELLQAVGVSQTDYLTKVAAFQRRESEQGRPVAVVVTSRTAVADRARAPEATVALRLEPFDDPQIAAWLETWNSTNARNFACREVSPLAPETVLAHRHLAEQPLLLFMLALYDADGNALPQAGADLRLHELYERLLKRFARREVDKHLPGLSERDGDRAVEEELRRLSVVAFAMFNRASLWVTEDHLDADLVALFGRPRPVASQDLRFPLRDSEITLGRFFFIHRARATQDETRMETYEFLHATFGEFLVARLTWQVLSDMAAREAASTMSISAGQMDDDLLRALLSFAPLTARTPVIEFLVEMASGLEPSPRDALKDLLLRLFRAVHMTVPTQRFGQYRPRRLPEPAHYALYSANLLLLALCVVGTLRVSEVYGTQEDIVDAWSSQSLLWRSQLDGDEWLKFVYAVAVTRVWDGQRRDIRLDLNDKDYVTPAINRVWTFQEDFLDLNRIVSRQSLYSAAHRQAYFLCSELDDVSQHALEPMTQTLGVVNSTFIGREYAYPSAAHALLNVWLLPVRDATPEERRAAYARCTTIATELEDGYRHWDRETARRYAALLLDRLATDDAATPDLVADILAEFATAPVFFVDLAPKLVRCALSVLGLNRTSDLRMRDFLEAAILREIGSVDPVLRTEALVRLVELKVTDPLDLLPTSREIDDLVSSISEQRPDLVERLRRARSAAISPDNSSAIDPEG